MPNTAQHTSDTTTAPAIRAYLGGSFDPVHKGHVQAAMYVYQWLSPIAAQQQRALSVSLLPTARSPFKDNSTAPTHRLAMLERAVQDTPLRISELELWQVPPVYSIDSVRTLRQRYPHDTLIFIMGMDSAQSLDRWKDGLMLTDYVHLWIFSRRAPAKTPLIDDPTVMQDTTALSDKLPAPLSNRLVLSPAELLAPSLAQMPDNVDLKNTTQGRIYIDPRPVTAVSSTHIRQQLQQPAQTPSLPAPNLQTPAAASINAIMRHNAPNDLDKWLNPAVYQYIIDHQLYSAAQFR